MVAAALVLSIGLVIGGYSFLLNDGAGDLTDNSIPNGLDNSSKDNVSLDDNGKVSNGNSNNNQNVNSNNGKVSKDISANDLIDIVQVSPIQPISAFADDDIPAMYINVGYAASYNIDDNSYHNGAVITPGAFDNINKSEYMLSPNYDEHIFIKIGQDFTDLFVQCVDGDFIALGDITKPLPEKGICDLSCGAGDAYFDLNGPNVDYRNYDEVVYYIEHGKYPTDDQQVLGVIPIDGDESGYAGDYVEEPNDVNPINDDLPQENAVVENPQIVADFTTVE